MKTRIRSLTCVFLLALFLFNLLLMPQTVSAIEDPSSILQAASIPRDSRVLRLLVMGCDASDRLTDSIFLVSLHRESGSMGVVQIPRDTYANYTERDYKKINGAWSTLGASAIKSFYSQNFGIHIDYFVVLNLSNLRNMVDAVGGVDIEIPQDMDYSDPAQGLEIHFKEGIAHLDGKAAEEFVRYRSGYVNADLGRLDAQKLFMFAFATRLQGLRAGQVWRVLAASLTALQTDVPLTELGRTVAAFGACDTENIRFATMPGQAVQGRSGAWYYSLNREGAVRTLEQYLFADGLAEKNTFDPQEIFDRKDHADFHKIYIAPESALPTE